MLKGKSKVLFLNMQNEFNDKLYFTVSYKKQVIFANDQLIYYVKKRIILII